MRFFQARTRKYSVDIHDGTCQWHTVTGLLLLSLFVRGAVFFFAQNFDGDPIIRTMGALQWLKNPCFISYADPTITWVFGPLHFYINGIALALWNSPLYAPRVASLVLGTIAVIPFYYLTRLRFCERSAIYGSIAFCFFTLQVRYSAVAASEASNSLLIIVAILLLFRYLNNRSFGTLLLTALALNLTTMIRFENLLLVGVSCLIVFLGALPNNSRDMPLVRIDRQRINHAAILFGLSLIFMFSRMYGDFFHHGDILYSIGVSKSHFRAMYEIGLAERGFWIHHFYTSVFWPGVTWLAYSPLVGTMAFVGLYRALRQKKYINYCLIPISFWLAYTIQSTVTGTLATFARYSLPFGVFLLPLAGWQWAQISQKLEDCKRRAFDYSVVVSIAASFLFLSMYGIEGTGSTVRDKLSSISPVSRMPVYLQDVTTWINNNVDPSDRVVLDDYGAECDLIWFYSNLQLEAFEFRWESPEDLIEYLRTSMPRYAVYSPDATLKYNLSTTFALATEDSVFTEREITFRLRQSFPHYRIYELTYAQLSDTTAVSP